MKEKRITQAACLVKIDGIPEPQVIPLHRHSDMWGILKAFGFRPHQGYEVIAQGFIDNDGWFYNRQDAYALAKLCGQKVPEGKTELFSEDLY